MSVTAFALSASVLGASIAPATPETAREPIRCAPAPYYVADRHAGIAPLDRAEADKRTPRPCYLVRSDGPSSKRIA